MPEPTDNPEDILTTGCVCFSSVWNAYGDDTYTAWRRRFGKSEAVVSTWWDGRKVHMATFVDTDPRRAHLRLNDDYVPCEVQSLLEDFLL